MWSCWKKQRRPNRHTKAPISGYVLHIQQKYSELQRRISIPMIRGTSNRHASRALDGQPPMWSFIGPLQAPRWLQAIFTNRTQGQEKIFRQALPPGRPSINPSKYDCSFGRLGWCFYTIAQTVNRHPVLSLLLYLAIPSLPAMQQLYPPRRHLVILDGGLSSCCFPGRLSSSEAMRFAGQADRRRRLNEQTL